MKKFDCSECGLCCEFLGEAIRIVKDEYKDEELEKLYEDFPYTIDENGVCSKYDKKTKHCKVYKDRPLVCNVDSMYYSYYKKLFKNKKDYFKDLEKMCETLQNKENEQI